MTCRHYRIDRVEGQDVWRCHDCPREFAPKPEENPEPTRIFYTTGEIDDRMRAILDMIEDMIETLNAQTMGVRHQINASRIAKFIARFLPRP